MYVLEDFFALPLLDGSFSSNKCVFKSRFFFFHLVEL